MISQISTQNKPDGYEFCLVKFWTVCPNPNPILHRCRSRKFSIAEILRGHSFLFMIMNALKYVAKSSGHV